MHALLDCHLLHNCDTQAHHIVNASRVHCKLRSCVLSGGKGEEVAN